MSSGTHLCLFSEKLWVCVFENGVSWRSSDDYDDRAAGKGPQFGDTVTTIVAPKEGDDDIFFLKANVTATIYIHEH